MCAEKTGLIERRNELYLQPQHSNAGSTAHHKALQPGCPAHRGTAAQPLQHRYEFQCEWGLRRQQRAHVWAERAAMGPIAASVKYRVRAPFGKSSLDFI